MQHRRIDLKIDVPGSAGVQLAATIHLPPADRLGHRPPVMICMPGAGYNRLYYDLPEPGYSQAEYHAGQGIVLIALDHLGVGESSVPPPENCTLADVAAANSAVVRVLVDGLRQGSFTGGQIIEPGAIIGAGHSMGGFVTVAMQARYRPFDAIAVLGASMVCTRLPSRLSGQELRFAGDADPVQAAGELMMKTDWKFGCHWEDVPEHLVAVDIASKPPEFGPVAPWGSKTVPYIVDLVLPGTIAREAAIIDVPVLLAMGERDVCQDPLRELAAFHSTRDLALTIIPRMAHNHNFAGTRAQLWRRLDAFAAQIAAS